MATSFSDGGSWSTQREPPTLGKQPVNFITCGCESSAPFFVIYKAENLKDQLIKYSRQQYIGKSKHPFREENNCYVKNDN